MAAPLVRMIFEQPDAATAWEQHARVVEQLTGRFDEAADLLAEARPDILSFYAFPKAHHRQLRSNCGISSGSRWPWVAHDSAATRSSHSSISASNSTGCSIWRLCPATSSTANVARG